MAALRQLFRPENIPGTLAGAGVLLAAASVVLPWFALADLVAGKGDPSLEYGLTQSVAHFADGTSRVVPYDTRACDCFAVATSFGLVQLLAWTGALLGAGALVGRSFARIPRAAATALIAGAGALTVLAPVLLATGLPTAFLADGNTLNHALPDGRWGSSFWGAQSVNVARTLTWSPGAGWFVSLMACGLLLGSLRFKGPEALAAPAPAAAPTRARSPAPVGPAGNGALLPEGLTGQNAFVVPPP
ncbi:MAG TPA: hypothetical protein VJ547_05580 [Candidatus Thermoplasmatota archaeon]|nr:hypothetical protein [Candidatus Thermoplasmatota archaeon]